MGNNSFDAIVLGVGGMGSAACWALAKRGVHVLGLEQFEIGHLRGSSHGESRLIRQAYFEHPNYVPLLKSAYELWNELEAEAGIDLFFKTGLVIFGPENGAIVRGAQESARLHDIPLTVFNERDAAKQFPAFQIPPQNIGVYEPGAGWLAVEACVRTMASQAQKHGASIVDHTHVERWEHTDNGVAVHTDHGIYHAPRLIITAGAWSPQFLTGVRDKIDVRRVPVAWFAPRTPAPAMPCFAYETSQGFFYGFPPQARGLKLGLHVPGRPVLDPVCLDRTMHSDDAAPLERFVAEHLTWVNPCIQEHSVCMYSMSPDEHFIIDQDGSAVTYAAGFSGHGFKFATVIGAILADVALTGSTSHPISFLRQRWPAS